MAIVISTRRSSIRVAAPVVYRHRPGSSTGSPLVPNRNALSFVEIGPQAYYAMLLFVGILAVGLVYAWKKGALQWR